MSHLPETLNGSVSTGRDILAKYEESLYAAYRADIDGLRAICVTLVMLFHLGVPGFGGGFVGVDIFFVISGFLITGLIVNDVERKTFSLVKFYERRARRILPMLIIIVVVLAVAGYVLLLPGDYKVFGESARAALFASSNFYFMHHTGYFDIPAQTMPLLHTWSLGVEEQFYFVWPAAILLGRKLLGDSRRRQGTSLILVILASFVYSLWVTGHDQKMGFYSPVTRAWELALGGLLIFIPRPRPQIAELMPAFGLSLIAISVYTLSAAAPFPRFNAIPSTVGAALVLYPQATAAQRLLGATPLRSLGLVSYSLYLWHWPLIVFWRLYENEQPTFPILTNLTLVATAVALSAFTWRYVEQPARRLRLGSTSVFGWSAAVCLLSIIALSSIVWTKGYPGRLSPQMEAIDDKEKMWAWTCPQSVSLGILANGSMTTSPSCAYGADWKTARHHAVIWGDSLSEHMAPIFDLAGRKSDTAIAIAYACAAITGKGSPRYISSDLTPNYDAWCDPARDRVLDLITGQSEIDTVLLSTSWSFLLPLLDVSSEHDARKILRSGLDGLIDQLTKEKKRVIIVADVAANLGPDPASCVMALHAELLRRPCPKDPAYIDISTIGSQVETHQMLKDLVANHSGVALIDPMDFLCDSQRCKAVINGELIYRDAVHFRRNLSPTTLAVLERGMQVEKVLGGK